MDLQKLNGDIYTDVTIVKQTPSGLEILHSRGGTYLSFSELTTDARQKFKYSEEADKFYQKKLQKRKEVRLAKLNKLLTESKLVVGEVNVLYFKKTTYLIYIPFSAKIDSTGGLSLVAIVHGTGRDAHAYINSFVDEAEEYGVALIAPLFDDTQFRHYQFIYYEGLDMTHEVRARLRSDLRFNDILDLLKKEHPFINTKQFCMYGFSGGAQFTMRYTLLYPYRVTKAVVVSPGSYLFPDSTQEFPRGIKYSVGYPRPNYSAFIKKDILFCIGKKDTGALGGIKSFENYDFQGKNRYVRHMRFKSAVQKYAREKNVMLKHKFYVAPNAGHQLLPFHQKAVEFLFDK